MNVYQKLALARQKLKASGLKQSGKNKGVGYTYFDLADILPQTTQLEQELGLLSVVSFTETEGTLTMYNTEQVTECITFKSPLRDAKLCGCHPVQNLGAVETYVRRYLYLLAYEIVETDALDLTQDNGEKAQNKADKGREAQSSAQAQESPQNANNAATGNKQEPSKAQIISELIKGTDIQAAEITKWIENNIGSPKRVNELTDEEFKKLHTALERAIKETAKKEM